MRISDWSSDVCSSDLREVRPVTRLGGEREAADLGGVGFAEIIPQALPGFQRVDRHGAVAGLIRIGQPDQPVLVVGGAAWVRQRSLLEQHGLVAGARQGPGCRQADDAAPDDDDLHWLGTFLPRAAGPAACTPAAPRLP